MGWVVVLVAGLIGALCGARLTIGGTIVVLGAVLLLILGLCLASGLGFWATFARMLSSLVALEFGYLVGAFALAGRRLPRWHSVTRLDRADESDRAQ